MIRIALFLVSFSVRAKTRATLLACLGDLPARPDPRKVRVLSREDKGTYILHH